MSSLSNSATELPSHARAGMLARCAFCACRHAHGAAVRVWRRAAVLGDADARPARLARRRNTPTLASDLDAPVHLRIGNAGEYQSIPESLRMDPETNVWVRELAIGRHVITLRLEDRCGNLLQGAYPEDRYQTVDAQPEEYADLFKLWVDRTPPGVLPAHHPYQVPEIRWSGKDATVGGISFGASGVDLDPSQVPAPWTPLVSVWPGQLLNRSAEVPGSLRGEGRTNLDHVRYALSSWDAAIGFQDGAWMARAVRGPQDMPDMTAWGRRIKDIHILWSIKDTRKLR